MLMHLKIMLNHKDENYEDDDHGDDDLMVDLLPPSVSEQPVRQTSTISGISPSAEQKYFEKIL